jgi:hypothetical protein
LNGAICRLFNARSLFYSAAWHPPMAAHREMTPTLLVVDDEKTTREGLRAALGHTAGTNLVANGSFEQSQSKAGVPDESPVSRSR